MKKNLHYIFIFFYCTAFFYSPAQEPDLSSIRSDNEKIKAWLGYCELLKAGSRFSAIGSKGDPQNKLKVAALKGLALAGPDDASDQSRFSYYVAFGYYLIVPMNEDSVEYYFYQSLHQAQKAKDAALIVKSCSALMHASYEMQETVKADSNKAILQSIIDTTKDKWLLIDGYTALGNYYQQKSYYNTAQDYFLKSISLRKNGSNIIQTVKEKTDYAAQCYTLAKLYMKTDVPGRALSMMYEGDNFSSLSPVINIRYKAFYAEIFCKMGYIDSALYYLKRYIQPMEVQFKSNPVLPAEIIFPNLAVARYYTDHKLYPKALPYLDKSFDLANKGSEAAFIYETQIAMGRYLLETGKFLEAIPLLAKALPVAKQFSRELYIEALKYMALAQKGSGNFKDAFRYSEQYSSQADSLSAEKLSRNFADQETRYETGLKTDKIAFLDKENRLNILELQNASRTRLMLALGLGALSIISLLLYFIYRNKEKVNKVLNQQNDQLEILNGQLAVANETKAKLFSIIGHDLRSPVSQIVQLLQVQKENPGLLNEQSRAQHETRLKTASENVLETMEDLLLWSKSQMQYFTPQFLPVNIAASVEKELNLLQQRIEDKKLVVDNKLEENFVIITDENFLAIIIRNLLQNAVKYSNEGSAIHISANTQNIFITNQSSQADVGLLNALLHNKQVDSKASGLGLQIANDLASSVNAKIFFEQTDNNIITATISWVK